MTSLYTIASRHMALAQKLADIGADEATIADTLDGEAEDLDAKLVAYAMVARNLEVVADAKKAAAASMLEQAATIAHRVEYLRGTIHRTMLACGRKKIDSDPSLTLALKGKAPAVQILDASLIPWEYMDEPPAPAPRPAKARIAAALKAGQDVPGAAMGDDVTRLEIA